MSDDVTVVAFGESVVWGQGLWHVDKFPSLIHDDLSTSSCGPLRRDLIKARSGAVIETDSPTAPLPQDIPRWGRHEVPHGVPSISEQVASYPDQDDPDPGDVDVVVLGGGINDVGVNTILDPRTGFGHLRRETENHVYSDLRDLLEEVLETFPSATVVVPGYFPLLTDESEPPPLEAIERTLGIEELTPGDYPVLGTLWDQVERRARFFHRYQLWMLSRAVASVLAPGRLVVFAHPGFTPENAIWGDEPLVFGPLDDDPARNVRIPACQLVHGSASGSASSLFDTLFDIELVRCKIASTGHPNRAGARRYAETALRRRDHHREVSVRDLLTDVLGTSGDSLDVESSLDRYGLDGERGLRSLASLREVDCIAVRLDSEFVRVEVNFDDLPPAVQLLIPQALINAVRHQLHQMGEVITVGERLFEIAVHSWVDHDALATLEVDLDGGRTVTRQFDSRGYDVIDAHTSPIYDPLPGTSRTDVAILDPMFDSPHARVPLAACQGIRIRMADVARQVFERLYSLVLGDFDLPVGRSVLEDIVSAVWRINGVEIDVDGRRVFDDTGGHTLESGQEWTLNYPS